MSNDLFVHEDITEAARHFKIPVALYRPDDVYIMQEDRCVFVGQPKTVKHWIKRNSDRYCESMYPLNAT